MNKAERTGNQNFLYIHYDYLYHVQMNMFFCCFVFIKWEQYFLFYLMLYYSRDQHVAIQWNNIQDGKLYIFKTDIHIQILNELNKKSNIQLISTFHDIIFAITDDCSIHELF